MILLGASGSGKSTLLRALSGTLPPEGATGLLEVGSARLGLVQQEPEANIVMELLGDDVAFPLENAAMPAPEIWPRVRADLMAAGLELPLDRPTSRLSGGQQQLLGLVAATVARPDLLLLDEPTANLDAAAAQQVLHTVLRLRAELGCTVVVVEHRIEQWLPQADRVLVFDRGTVTPVADLLAHLEAHPDLAERAWLGHRQLPSLRPDGAPGGPVIEVRDVAMDDRLRPTSLTVRRGEVVALTGPPGSGKSTLLACLSGLMTPSSGSVRVAGREDPWRWSAAEVSATFGVVFQNPEHQFITGRVADELRHGLPVAGFGKADRLAERLGLAHLAEADPFTLSGGEQRRLSVATALVLDPEVLVLDEPTFGQDPATWAELSAIIAERRDSGAAVVMATHDQELVDTLGAREVRLVPLEVPAAVGDRPQMTGLRAREPLALLGSGALLSVAALASTSVALNLALACFALLAALVGRLPPRRVVLLCAPALIAAGSVAFSNALLGGGITEPASWQAAALPASRVLAVALPGLVVAASIDPTALADSLVTRLGVPARTAYSVLAGFRLLPLLTQEWQVLERANRARGMGGRGLGQRARRFGSLTLRLLVGALRRAGRLAVALDARGLHSGDRTVARPLRWSAADTGALLVALAWVAAAVAL